MATAQPAEAEWAYGAKSASIARTVESGRTRPPCACATDVSRDARTTAARMTRRRSGMATSAIVGDGQSRAERERHAILLPVGATHEDGSEVVLHDHDAPWRIRACRALWRRGERI